MNIFVLKARHFSLPIQYPYKGSHNGWMRSGVARSLVVLQDIFPILVNGPAIPRRLLEIFSDTSRIFSRLLISVL
jgi:hypothetical protein